VLVLLVLLAALVGVGAADEVVAVVQMAVAVQMEAVVCMVVCLGEARAAAVRVRSR
jgi:hypothetical protein